MQEITTRAPGRINIIGEHVDYLGGFVMPAAIGFDVRMTVSKNGSTSKVLVTARDFNENYSFDLKSYKATSGGWPNYIMGVFKELEKLGAQIQGCDISFTSTVPIGAGLSSSAALECSLALALNELWKLNFSKIELIKAAQLAEHNFVGIKCGIMDQFASIMGKKDEVILLDCRSLEFKYYPLDLGAYRLLLLNSNVSHELANSAYNDRRLSSEKALEIIKEEYPNVTNFRDVTKADLNSLKLNMSDKVFNCALHAITENERTRLACDAIKGHDLEMLGTILYKGHESLKTYYEVTCGETDFLVDLARQNPFVLGARQMGGGFGGCTINLILKDEIDTFIDQVAIAYQKLFGKSITPHQIDLADGASIVSSS